MASFWDDDSGVRECCGNCRHFHHTGDGYGYCTERDFDYPLWKEQSPPDLGDYDGCPYYCSKYSNNSFIY